jgi:hypothetical protein
MAFFTISANRTYKSVEGNWDPQAPFEVGGGTISSTTHQEYTDDGMYEDYHVGYIGFDLSGIPAGSTINSAELKLNMYYANPGSPNGDRWWIYRVTSWASSFSYSTSNVTSDPLDITGTYSNHYASVTQLVRDMMGTGVYGFRVHANSILYWSYIQGKDTGFNAPQLTIDYTPPNSAPNTPTASISGISSNNQPTSASQLTINWVFTDPDGNTQGYYQVQGSNNGWGSVGYDTGKISSSGARSVTTTTLAEGTWQFRVRTWDPSNVISPDYGYTVSVRVDRTQPTASSVDGVKYTNTGVRFHLFGVGDGFTGVQTVNVYLRRADNSAWLIEGATAGQSGDTWYYDFSPPADGQGAHLVRFHIWDWANNLSVAYDTTWYYDTTAPTVSNPNVGATPVNIFNGGTKTVSIDISDNLSGANISDSYWGRPDGVWTQVGAMAGNGTKSIVVPITIEGTYTVHFYVNDNAGNAGPWPYALTFVIDRSGPANPSPSITNVKSDSATMNWNAYSDTSTRSNTFVYLGRWNGSSWVTVVDGLDVGNVTTYNWTGLAAGTSYQATVVYRDVAGNTSPVSWAAFTTNTLPVASITNLSSSGSLYSQRPRIRVTGSDSNSSAVVFQIQIDNDSNFSSPLVDSIADNGGNNAGWSVKTSQVSGSVNYYTPTSDIGTGTRYARVRAWDVNAGEWGPWSSGYQFTIGTRTWTYTVNTSDTGVRLLTMAELRDAVAFVIAARGLSHSGYTDGTVTPNVTVVKAVHLTELRNYINSIYTALGVAPPIWTDATIVPDVTQRKGTHWIELRNAITSM